MPRQQPAEVNRDLVEKILALPDRERQEGLLRESGLLNEGGLDRLLDEAEHLMGDDPGKTRRLAELCARVAESAEAPAAVPRANYVCAGAYNANGEFEEDLRLTKAAHDGYVALGMNLEALRTNVGKMDALLELGRYQEALDAGQVILDALYEEDGLNIASETQELDLLAALVQQNRGLCYELIGQYDAALDAYATAEKLYLMLGVTDRLSEVVGNRGAVLLQQGRSGEALEAYEKVAVASKESGLTLSYAKALGNIGEAHLQLGNYTQSLAAFERVHLLLNSLDALASNYHLLIDIANVYLILNLYSEALAAYREVDKSLQAKGMAHDRAQTLWGMGLTLIAQAELEEGERVLTEAASLFDTAGNLPMLSGVMLEQASLRSTRGNREGAQAIAQRALRLVSDDEWPVQRIYAHLRLADLLMPNAAETEPHLLKARRLAENLALPQLRYRLNERLGRLRRLQGRNEEARELLKKAIEQIEGLRGTVSQDAMRASFLRDKIAAYEELLRLYLDGNGDKEGIRQAFTVAEQAKSRALVDLLAGVAERETSPADHELEEQIRALQADLNAIYNQLLTPDDVTRRVALSPLGNRAAELEAEIGRLRLRAAATAPASLTSPPPVTDLVGAVPPDVVLVAYHVVGNEVLAFVVARGDVRVRRHLGTSGRVQQLLQQLEVQWDRLHAGGAFADRHARLLERSTRRILGAMHDELMAPLRELLEADASEDNAPAKLVIVPHGPLHQVPFHALFDGERYLLERFEVSYAPSATVFALSGEREPAGSGGALVMAVEDPTIPNAAAEAHAVAERLPGAGMRVGEAATVEALWSQSPGRAMLHLACHGLFRSDNPMFSALKLHDGWLMAHDAMGLDLDGALVTLSACESGRSAVIGGDEILGLTRAFLGAGAATLVVSLWLVQDATTAELMARWYENLRGGMGRAGALRAAQLEVMERHPHPFYWAPFVLIGHR